MTRKLLPLVCVCLFMSLIAKSQQAPPAPVEDKHVVGIHIDDTTAFKKVEKEASFPGGLAAWQTYLMRNLRADVPVKNKAPAGKYNVVVRFIVSKDGSISHIQPQTHHGFGMEEEVVRIIKKGPKWKPAIQDGRAVNAYQQQPVTFVLSGR